MKKIYIDKPQSCSRRKLDAEKISNYFLKNNYCLVNSPKKADIIILVTCAYIDDLAEQCFKKIKKFKTYNAELIVAGCLPAIDEEKLNKSFKGKTIVTKNIEKIDEIFSDNKIKFVDLEDANRLWKKHSKKIFSPAIYKACDRCPAFKELYSNFIFYIFRKIFGERSSTFNNYVLKFHKKTHYIRISWGCPGNCSYCAIKKAVGPLKSKPFDQCIKEFRKGISNGAKNFIIAADDIGSYGLDIGRNFTELLDKLTSSEGDYSIEIESINPRWVVKYIGELERIMKRGKIKRICSPIQSGSERILKLMNRYPDKEKIKNSLLKLKKTDPNLILGTEYILGFPTETMEEFKKTLIFIKEIKFDWIIIHPYSKRKGIEAEKFNPKIERDEIKRRVVFLKKYLSKAGYDVKKSVYSSSLVINIR